MHITDWPSGMVARVPCHGCDVTKLLRFTGDLPRRQESMYFMQDNFYWRVCRKFLHFRGWFAFERGWFTSAEDDFTSHRAPRHMHKQSDVFCLSNCGVQSISRSVAKKEQPSAFWSGGRIADAAQHLKSIRLLSCFVPGITPIWLSTEVKGRIGSIF